MPTVRTPTLEIGYEEWGDAAGAPVVLLHGFPDDAHAWNGVAPPLAAQGCRVLAPYLRGYGPTRFLDAAAPRMAQQAAIGQDLLDFLDALGIERAALGGYDWGGRAACITEPPHSHCWRRTGHHPGVLAGNPSATACQKRCRSSRRAAGGRPGDSIADLPVAAAAHSLGRPIHTPPDRGVATTT